MPGRVLLLIILALLTATAARAEVTSVRIAVIDSFAVGKSFGDVGAYERVIGTVQGDLDPADPRNAGIFGLAQAPRNARGRVTYEADLFLLRPVDPTRGNGILLYEVPNRGRKLMLQMLVQVPPAPNANPNDPKLPYDAGDGLLFHRGYVMAWAGWEAGAGEGRARMAARLPVLRGSNQIVRQEFLPGARGLGGEGLPLRYPVIHPDTPEARLSMRAGEADPPREIPRSLFRFKDDTTLELLLADPKPVTGLIYDLTYRAKDPVVGGIGFAIQRDVVAFLRSNTPGSDGAANPAGGRIDRAIGFGISQSGRFLRDFIRGGFNQGLDGKKVFDGVLAHTAGIGGVFLNELFAQPGTTRTGHQDRFMPENRFPFSVARTRDPLSGQEAALLRSDGFDPLLMLTNTSTEYWQKGASLLGTDPQGRRDLDLPDGTRTYLIAGTQHGGRPGSPDTPGSCVNPRNPHSAAPALRALLQAMAQWVRDGTAPPASRIPRVADGTLTEAANLNFPAIPGILVPRAATPVDPPGDWVKPDRRDSPYKVLVPSVLPDGNENSGIRLPDIAMPTATYTGWNQYAPPFPPGVLCDREGSRSEIAVTDAARVPGDPRPSLKTRYGDKQNYLGRLRAVVRDLVRERLLLEEDGAEYIAAAERMPEF